MGKKVKRPLAKHAHYAPAPARATSTHTQLRRQRLTSDNVTTLTPRTSRIYCGARTTTTPGAATARSGGKIYYAAACARRITNEVASLICACVSRNNVDQSEAAVRASWRMSEHIVLGIQFGQCFNEADESYCSKLLFSTFQTNMYSVLHARMKLLCYYIVDR